MVVFFFVAVFLFFSMAHFLEGGGFILGKPRLEVEKTDESAFKISTLLLLGWG